MFVQYRIPFLLTSKWKLSFGKNNANAAAGATLLLAAEDGPSTPEIPSSGDVCNRKQRCVSTHEPERSSCTFCRVTAYSRSPSSRARPRPRPRIRALVKTTVWVCRTAVAVPRTCHTLPVRTGAAHGIPPPALGSGRCKLAEAQTTL
ncbi:hypothetical protein BD310DRAFT_929973 [Dichomitus squalens]|uniref:Uncharacterized protein n=1 Tax=Dichomitus squalens TaxID=114155 RepID=A0A4Q9PS72_9APHY|nr:hypothetical protein BD310DRAFT_929973 [Dichomitus squalens]